MTKKKPPERPIETPAPEIQPEIEMPVDPENPLTPQEDPDIIPFEDPYETPPYEVPPPAEGP
jgi:hypothetical protein